jgi:ABC-2 type transport system permease protein
MTKPRSALAELTLIRFREFIREPEAVFWTLVFPILLAAGLGIAFRQRPRETVPVAVSDSSARAGAVFAALRKTPGLTTKLMPPADADRALTTGDVALVVRTLLSASGGDSVDYRYDDARPEARNARLVADDALQAMAGRQNTLSTGESHVSERGARYIDFLIPGLLGMNLMGSGIWGVGFAIVDARRKRLLKRLIATPMRRHHYLASFLFSRLGLLLLEVLVLVGFGAIAFKVPLRGSFLTLGVICLLGALAFGGIGLLMASRAKTIEGASGLMNLVMMPMWIFSGVFFSSSNFPDAAQPIIRALPLTALNDALRANMLRGAELPQLLPQIGIITAWLVFGFVAAMKMFRWR